jgi:hypothetical protein
MSNSKRTYDDFLAAIRQRESRNRYTIVNQYGFLGAYQMGEAALIDAGFYLPDGTKKNDWKGTWTSMAQDMGIHSKADFLGAKITKVKVEGKEIEKIEQDLEKIKNARQAQDEAVKAYYRKVWGYICHWKLDAYIGRNIRGVEITESALIAAYHLVGLGTRDETSTKRKGLLLYLKRDGEIDPADANGTPVSEYIELFNDYEVPFKAKISLKSQQSFGADKPLNTKQSNAVPCGVVPPQPLPSSIRDRWPWDSNTFDDGLADLWDKMMP